MIRAMPKIGLSTLPAILSRLLRPFSLPCCMMLCGFHEVYVDTSDGQDAPYLYLSGTRADGSTNLPAILINGSSSSDRKPSDELTFIYPVVHGDDVSGMVLEVADRSAIQDGATLLDLQDREVNVTLPTIGAVASLSGTSAISIDTNAPVITAISSSLVGGEYGVGQVRIRLGLQQRLLGVKF